VSYKSSILYDVEFGLCVCESVWSSISRDVRIDVVVRVRFGVVEMVRFR
jgi:hypothetical protein